MQDWRSTAINVGVSLLAMAVGQLRLISTGRPLSRASSAPTGDFCWVGDWRSTAINVGAELARDGGGSVEVDIN